MASRPARQVTEGRPKKVQFRVEDQMVSLRFSGSCLRDRRVPVAHYKPGERPLLFFLAQVFARGRIDGDPQLGVIAVIPIVNVPDKFILVAVPID
jgi:hypothetical protein